MAREPNPSGHAPPDQRAESAEPQNAADAPQALPGFADYTDPDTIFKRLQPPGLLLQEALKLLSKPNEDEAITRIWNERKQKAREQNSRAIQYKLSANPSPWPSGLIREPSRDSALIEVRTKYLKAELLSGLLLASGQVNNSPDRIPIDKTWWLDTWRFGPKSATRSRPKTTIDNIRITLPETAEVDSSLITTLGREGSKKGPPATYNWDTLIQEWLNEIIEKQVGFPKTKAEAHRILVEIYMREFPERAKGRHPTDRAFFGEMEKRFPKVWININRDKKDT